MKLTMPQIIMLNHASWVNYENSTRRSKAKHENKDQPNEVREEARLVAKLSPVQLSHYLSVPFT